MKLRTARRFAVVGIVLAALATACGDSTGGRGSGGSGPGFSSGRAADFVGLGGWEDEACWTSQPKVVVGITEPISVADTTLKDYVDGTQAAVDAFNIRGGVSGRCLELKVCDGKGDGPTELSCARQQVENPSMVAILASTFLAGEADAYQLFETAGLPSIGAQVTQPGAWNSPVSYEFTMGGSGAILAAIPALKSVGVKKFAVFFPASGQSSAFSAFAAPLVKNLGMKQTEVIEIPPKAEEFTQYVRRAQNSGAEGVVLGLPGNVAIHIIDAMDSLNSNLKLAGSWGTFSHKSVEEMPGHVGPNMAFGDAVPPVGMGIARWPILQVIADDIHMKVVNNRNLERGALTAQVTSGWLSVYALVKVLRDARPTAITRATVKQAFDQASNIPMFNLTPPWTPSKQSTNPIFKGISNPSYWTGHWDAGKQDFAVDDKQVDILELLKVT